MKFVGQPAVDVVYCMEKRSVKPFFGFSKECGDLMTHNLSGIVLYMFGNNSFVLGIKREITIAPT